jgi:3-hydroxymyristoyl/3-hydroxydecanoyl-(acyl carrier protein) dehydratase
MKLFPTVDPAPDGRPRFLVPAESPLFAGHFPGHSILPGIAQLGLVFQGIAQEIGNRAIVEIPSLRLRSPVHPGDLLTARLEAVETTVRFELSREEEAVSSGTLRLGDSGGPARLPEVDDAPGSYPDVETLVPHALPARLVHSVQEVSAEGLTGVAMIPRASPFVVDGQAPAFLGLEAAAQGAAVLEALGRREGPATAGPRIGYLVAIRGARLAVATLPADRPFRIVLRLTGSAPPLSIYEVTAYGETELLRGSISTYLLPEG